jgi:hypothetical protein
VTRLACLSLQDTPDEQTDNLKQQQLKLITSLDKDRCKLEITYLPRLKRSTAVILRLSKRQFTTIYDRKLCKTTVHVIGYDRLWSFTAIVIIILHEGLIERKIVCSRESSSSLAVFYKCDI